MFRIFATCDVGFAFPLQDEYGRTSVARTLMARLPRLFQTRS